MSFIPNCNSQNSYNNIKKNENNGNGNTLKNEIEKLKKDIIRLNNENNSLKNENQKLKNDNQNLKSQINIKDKTLNQYILKINELNNTLSNKKIEIDNLNNEMKNLKINNNQKNRYIREDELLIIQFKSIDQKVDVPYTCKNTDIFVRIEEMLYNEYPEYKDLNTYFTVNGHVVKRFRTIKENNIKNKDKILLNIYE